LPAEPVADALAPLEARWIVSRLNSTAGAVNRALEDYRFDEAAQLVYSFFWGDLCDWYLEAVKLRLDFTEGADRAYRAEQTRAALTTLLGVFEAALRLLSPFMPFLTEELWHAFYDGRPPAQSIALSRYPLPDPVLIDEAVEAQMASLQELIVEIRALRKDRGVPEKEAVAVELRSGLDFNAGDSLSMIQRLAKVSDLRYVERMAEAASVRSTPRFDIAIEYEKPIDVAAERERLGKELSKLEKEQANGDRQLANDAFLAKAPAAVVEGLRRRNSELALLVPKTRAALEALAGQQ
jgi:valyl-tRNA synthetase